MTKKEANNMVLRLFNTWKKKYRSSTDNSNEYYAELEAFKHKCARVHNIAGLYEALSDKNALKMASICSSIRFVQPHIMLMELQKVTGTY